MELEELRHKAAELFPAAVNFGIKNPGQLNQALDELQQLCSRHYMALGFSCQYDCLSEVTPKLEGSLSLEAWCRAEMEISGWNVNIHMRPFHLGAGYVHFEIIHDGPLGKFTETGYRSHFTPLATFAELTPEDYLTLIIETRPREQQLSLF